MKDNKYTRAINAVRISDKALENGLKYARENSVHERKGKVIVMKKNRLAYWETVAVAACLAVVIGVGGAAWLESDSGKNVQTAHDFTITANAAELKRGVRLEVDELTASGGGVEFIEEDKALGIEQGIPFNIRVEGDDIESVTFSTEKYMSDEMRMKFMLRNDFASLVENNGTDNKISSHSYIPGCTGATTFTVPYESQLTDKQFEPYADVNGDEDMAQAWLVPLELYVITDSVPAEDFYAEHPDFMNDRNPDMLHSAIMENFSRYFNENSELAKISVTVKYNDGAEQTEEIQLYCELKEFQDGWKKAVIYASLCGDDAGIFEYDNTSPDTPIIG